MAAAVGDCVLPGDVVNLDSTNSKGKTKFVLGPGLRQQSNYVVAIKPGVLRFREQGVYWVDSHQKRYIPARGDNVIGVVLSKAGDVFRVDIGASEPASLSYLAFEGATKRNRPDVKVGDLIYARLIVANKDMEPELACIDGNGRSSGLGPIRGGGYVIHTSISLSRKILSMQSELLQQLGKSMPYEIAVGLNGRIWVNGRSTQETLAITDVISSAEFMNKQQIKDTVRKLINKLSGF
jgi:exosome complex component RRP40